MTAKEATLQNMTVWFNKKAISNFISYTLLTETGQVVADSASNDSVFNCVDGEVLIELEKLGCGLYFYDSCNSENPNKLDFLSYSMIQTSLHRE